MKNNHIAVNSEVHFGQPCIAGTRIPVYCILELVQAGIPFNEIITKHYPDISVEDIKACIEYATDIVKAEEVHISEK